MDKISVIIPVYKVENVLDECVNSVVGQSYTELEIILVDDGSPDSCPRKCDEWAERDGRVKVIHQENRGLSGARNSGLEVMTGKYVTFVDSDDALHPEAIRILYDALIGDGSDMSVGRFKVFSEHPEAEEISDGERESRVLDRVAYMNGGRIMNRPEAWGKLYKAELFEGISYKEGILYEDLQISPYICHRAERISTVEASIYMYRRAENHSSIMSSGFSRKKFVIFDILTEHARFYSRFPEYREADVRVRERLLTCFAKGNVILWQKKCFGGLLKYYFKALPVMIFSNGCLGYKEKLAFLASCLPLPPLRKYYRRTFSGSINFDETNNI